MDRPLQGWWLWAAALGCTGPQASATDTGHVEVTDTGPPSCMQYVYACSCEWQCEPIDAPLPGDICITCDEPEPPGTCRLDAAGECSWR